MPTDKATKTTKTQQAHLRGEHETNPKRQCPQCWAIAFEATAKILRLKEGAS